MKYAMIILLFLGINSVFAYGHEWIYDYDYSDYLPPSQDPPGGLSPEEVPMFITIGFDDNSRSGIDTVGSRPTEYDYPEGMLWALKYFRTLTNPEGEGNAATYDGTPVRVAFYNTSYYASGYNGDNPALIRRIWNELYEDGHEIGNHTHTHSENLQSADAAQWREEVQTCNEWMTKPLAPDSLALWQQAESDEFGSGIPQEHIIGFRTPFLAYGGPLFPTLKEEGLIYDCTIEEGNYWEHDGRNFRWPYTLDYGSPGHEEGWSGNPDNPDFFEVPAVPGFWQLPNHVAMIPSAEEAKKYGIDYSISEVIADNISWVSPDTEKITMFDYNLWAQAGLNNEEVLAIMKFTFDRRMEGNRAPLMIGAHSEYFHHDKDGSCENASDTRGRQKVFEDFLEYALSHPEVRVVRPIDIISWMRNPVPLEGDFETSVSQESFRESGSISAEVVSEGFHINHGASLPTTRINISLYTVQGRRITQDVVDVQSGSFMWNPDISLTPGAYILQINGTPHRVNIQ
ncbi:polysaccharide deacetylase family protein [Chitinivibrio alkaliphilus]|uniref:Chitin deacetylase n=1 Tax=Chitinivibrio alkaliphilus ACht1 TaxID=1313304 RepID=U7D5Y5_9BACT|nr:polysaccharide deacetylase family protein [Chitinivibrio alkaliphilus]ERP31924.1 Chitin deacetylase [Chitinivibrio alkaliphilus ACht1]